MDGGVAEAVSATFRRAPIRRGSRSDARVLFASRFDGGKAQEVWRQVVGFESLNVHLNKRDERTPEFRKGATAAINDRTCCCHDPSMFLHDLNGLEHASSTSQDILCDQKRLV